MSASSSAASSSVSRSRTAVVLITAIAAAYGVYYLHQSAASETTLTADPTVTANPGRLHRSNAVRRGSRRTRTSDGEEDEDHLMEGDYAPEQVEEEEEEEVVAEVPIGPLGDGETVVDEADQGGPSWQNPSTRQRNGQNIVQLLFRVSEDATRRNAYIHRGCMCNCCGDLIRGIRYRCMNCIDYDLCETCETLDRHVKTHIFCKVRVPITAYATRQTQPLWYPGDPDSNHAPSSLPKDLLIRLSKQTGFERPELDAYWEQWTFMANTEWREDPDDLKLVMDRKTFDKCLIPAASSRHSPPNLIYDRMFAFYDTNNDHLISFPEYLNGLAFRKKKDKLKKVFEGYDIDGDGYVERKDFLRIFRCYYVLQKERQRDMLESMDDRVMNSTWAQKLVEGRQPLSSAFGHDGNFESGPNPRRMEGKMQHPGGELELTDGKGVVRESSNDFGNRDDIIIDAVSMKNPRITSLDVSGEHEYWQIMLNPPQTIADLSGDVLERLIENRHGAQRSASHQDEARIEPNDGTAESLDRSMPDIDIDVAYASISTEEFAQQQRPTRLSVPAESSAAIHRRLVAERAQQQEETVNSQIHERWKRRQFYTDEEEGSTAPADWNDDDDVSYKANGSSEVQTPAHTQPHHLSPRSRSSSKVRFAEDTDDYDTRSNPSTSSRSVPERWGGMDIPDAERDAGKEILYQVAQQAFNELIDPLFKPIEDRAIAAMSNAEARALLKPLLESERFETWAQSLDALLSTSKDTPQMVESGGGKPPSWIERPVIPEVELADVRQRPLEHLLAATGFEVVEDSATLVNNAIHSQSGSALPQTEVVADSEGPQHGVESSAREVEEIPSKQALPMDTKTRVQIETDTESLCSTSPANLNSGYDPTLPQYRPNSVAAIVPEPTNIQSRPELAADIIPDTTLPQFRPNSETDIALEPALPQPRPESEAEATRDTTLPQFRPSAISNGMREPSFPVTPAQQRLLHSFGMRPQAGNRNKSEALDWERPSSRRKMPAEAKNLRNRAYSDMQRDGMESKMLIQFDVLDWMDLYDLRSSGRYEQESKERGGWGRMNWLEFERVVKEKEKEKAAKEKTGFMGDSTGRGMDYLGSWIEFCIP